MYVLCVLFVLCVQLVYVQLLCIRTQLMYFLQVVYLAFPGTHGATYLDYNVVDKTVSPQDHRHLFTEKLIYMPQCYQTNSFKDLYPEVLVAEELPSRRAHKLPDDAVVYCTFNRLGRITPDMLAVWANILKRVPKAVLWLYKHPTMAVLRLLREARRLGIDCSSRLVFAGPVMPKTEHLKRLTLADVYLDTLVYNGHTTGSDVLWAGVPMVTIQGDSFPSRVGASLARAIDMEDMIAYNLEEYEEKAVELGLNQQKRLEMRRRLATKRLEAPLFDTARWVASFEESLETIWDRHAKNLPPRDIFPSDPGNMHSVRVSDSKKKWKEEKGDAFCAEMQVNRVRTTVPLSPRAAVGDKGDKAAQDK
jgi:protein O-GlcNAc transferase